MLAQNTGVLCAATAFGKTAVGAYLVAQRKINTLVLVHNAEIMKNQLKAFEKFLQIDEVLPEYTTPKGRHKKLSGIIGTLFCGRNRLGRMHTSACWNPCTTNGSANLLSRDKEDDGLMRIRSRDIALELLEETNT